MVRGIRVLGRCGIEGTVELGEGGKGECFDENKVGRVRECLGLDGKEYF